MGLGFWFGLVCLVWVLVFWVKDSTRDDFLMFTPSPLEGFLFWDRVSLCSFWLARSALWRAGWTWTQKSSCLCLPSAGTVGVFTTLDLHLLIGSQILCFNSLFGWHFQHCFYFRSYFLELYLTLSFLSFLLFALFFFFLSLFISFCVWLFSLLVCPSTTYIPCACRGHLIPWNRQLWATMWVARN